jgi:hypothetical protein
MLRRVTAPPVQTLLDVASSSKLSFIFITDAYTRARKKEKKKTHTHTHTQLQVCPLLLKSVDPENVGY